MTHVDFSNEKKAVFIRWRSNAFYRKTVSTVLNGLLESTQTAFILQVFHNIEVFPI